MSQDRTIARPVPPNGPGGTPLADVLDRNIRTRIEMRQKAAGHKGIQERTADAITRFTGSMPFVYLHLLWIGAWIVLNLSWLGIARFDPYPFGLLTLIGSLEAIFLATFVLISQNRMAAADAKRAELDLQISLLAEHEVAQVLTLVDGIARQLGVTRGADPAIEESKNDVSPATVLEAIDTYEQSLRDVAAFAVPEASGTGDSHEADGASTHPSSHGDHHPSA